LDKLLLEQCAYHWNYLNTVGYEKVADLVTISRFEDAVLNSINYAENICQLINVPYSTKDHKVKVGRWKENLTAEEIDIIWPMVRTTAEQFGYSI